MRFAWRRVIRTFGERCQVDSFILVLFCGFAIARASVRKNVGKTPAALAMPAGNEALDDLLKARSLEAAGSPAGAGPRRSRCSAEVPASPKCDTGYLLT